MSGHSKWSTIKHQKGAKDAKRGRLFAKLIRAIEVAARSGGGNPEGNPTLADAIQKAKDNSVPNDTIDRAVKRGAGELGGQRLELATYEAYGPGGVAMMVEALTDNRNRTAADIRHVVTKGGGSLADAAMMMQLGAEGVFVGSGIFKSGDPARRAEAIVKATTFYDDPDVVAKVSRGLGEPMVGIAAVPEGERLADRGW